MKNLMTNSLKFHRTFVLIAVASGVMILQLRIRAQDQVPLPSVAPHVIELLADSDSRYKIAGKRSPEITVKAGEPLAGANRGTGMDRSMAFPCCEPRTGPGWKDGTCCSNPASRNFNSPLPPNPASTSWSAP
jgi:hypothetical protein